MPITSFIVLTAYVLYAVRQVGVPTSLSATYYSVKKGWLFQLALGISGFLMMICLLELTAEKWFQFLSFFTSSALIFVAFAPGYKSMFEGRVHKLSAWISAVSSVALVSLLGFWYIPLILLVPVFFVIKIYGNRIFCLEMVCFASLFLTMYVLKIQ